MKAEIILAMVWLFLCGYTLWVITFTVIAIISNFI